MLGGVERRSSGTENPVTYTRPSKPSQNTANVSASWLADGVWTTHTSETTFQFPRRRKSAGSTVPGGCPRATRSRSHSQGLTRDSLLHVVQRVCFLLAAAARQGRLCSRAHSQRRLGLGSDQLCPRRPGCVRVRRDPGPAAAYLHGKIMATADLGRVRLRSCPLKLRQSLYELTRQPRLPRLRDIVPRPPNRPRVQSDRDGVCSGRISPVLSICDG